MKKFFFGLIIGLILATTFSATAVTNEIKLIVNGKTIATDVAPVQINGRVMVPARFVAEPLGASVQWDKVNNAVVVTNKINDISSNSSPYSDTIVENKGEINMDDWIDLKGFIQQSGAWVTSGSQLFIEKDDFKLTVAYSDIPNYNEPYSVNTSKGKLTIIRINGRVYLNINDLKEIGLLPQ